MYSVLCGEIKGARRHVLLEESPEDSIALCLFWKGGILKGLLLLNDEVSEWSLGKIGCHRMILVCDKISLIRYMDLRIKLKWFRKRGWFL